MSRSVEEICYILQQEDEDAQNKVLYELCQGKRWPSDQIDLLVNTLCEILETPTNPITLSILQTIGILNWPKNSKYTEKLIDTLISVFETEQFKSRVLRTMCLMGWPSGNYPQLNIFVTKMLQIDPNGITILENLMENSNSAHQRLCQGFVEDFGIATGHNVSDVKYRLKLQLKGCKQSKQSQSSKYLDIVEYTKRGMTDQVRTLAPKVNVNERDGYGDCAVIQAALRNELVILKILVEAGANLNVRSPNLMSPLDYARFNNNEEMIQYITTQ